MDSARDAQKPPIASALTVDSAPPATMTSASPYSMMRAASPRLWFAVEHALTIAMFGPSKPYWIDTSPATMLMIEPGTKNGEILRRPPRMKSDLVSSIIGSPPMPEPMHTPTRSSSPV